MSVDLRLSTRETIRDKSEFYKQTRDFFYERGVLEVFTSLLRKAPPTDAFLDHFECRAFADPEVFYVHSSPEYAMKQHVMRYNLDIYQICQVARANEFGRWHSKCFTMLEWYRIDKEINFLISEVADLVKQMLAIDAKPIIISYQQSYAQFANINNVHALESANLQDICLQKKMSFDQSWDKDDYLFLLMEQIIEPEISDLPLVFIYDYPASQAALSKIYKNSEGIEVANRFEVYSYGVEIGNGYNELQSFAEHYNRFEHDQYIRHKLGKPIYPKDEDFLLDLKDIGMPECVGIAMGLDRIFALSKRAKGLIL